jgi:hypothetical protein
MFMTDSVMTKPPAKVASISNYFLYLHNFAEHVQHKSHLYENRKEFGNPIHTTRRPKLNNMKNTNDN